MTYVVWDGGVIVRIPDAWGPRFHIGESLCERQPDGTIVVLDGDQRRPVQQWMLTGSDAMAAARDERTSKELSA